MTAPDTPRRSAPSLKIAPRRTRDGLDAVVTARWSDVTSARAGQVVRDEIVMRVRVPSWAFAQAAASSGAEAWADQVEDRAMRLAVLQAIRAAEDLIAAPFRPQKPSP